MFVTCSLAIWTFEFRILYLTIFHCNHVSQATELRDFRGRSENRRLSQTKGNRTATGKQSAAGSQGATKGSLDSGERAKTAAQAGLERLNSP